MTTIAFDGFNLAADGNRYIGDTLKADQTDKIFEGFFADERAFIAAFAGDMIMARLYYDYLLFDLKAEELTKFFNRTCHKFPDWVADDMNCMVFYLEFDGTLVSRCRHGDALSLVLPRAKYAIGSGADYAMGAMACGNSATMAVGVAHGLCPYTGVARMNVNVVERLEAMTTP